MAQDKMIQLHLIDGVLKGYEIEELTVASLENIEMCIAGEDWYVAVDKDGNIHQFIVEMTKHKARALVEIKDALEKIKSMQDEVVQEKATGGK